MPPNTPSLYRAQSWSLSNRIICRDRGEDPFIFLILDFNPCWGELQCRDDFLPTNYWRDKDAHPRQAGLCQGCRSSSWLCLPCFRRSRVRSNQSARQSATQGNKSSCALGSTDGVSVSMWSSWSSVPVLMKLTTPSCQPVSSLPQYVATT